MKTLSGEMLRPVLAKQLEWFVRAIAIAAWRWHLPLSPREDVAMAREECHILINAMTYGVLVPALVMPTEVNFERVIKAFFTDPNIDEKDSLHLAEALAVALGEALES